MAQQGVKISLKRNQNWKAHGPAAYARAVSRYSIKPSSNATTFFMGATSSGKLALMRRAATPGTVHTTSHHANHHHHHGTTGTGNEGAGTNPPTTGSGSGTGTGSGSAPVNGTGGGEAEVPADDVQNDLEYVVPVSIGTPSQTLNLDFDTGSADLWVWSTLLQGLTSAQTEGHTIYDPSKSSTAQAQSGDSWNISYGDGSSASGTVYTDVVTLGSGDKTVSIPNQAVEAANNLSSSFLSENASDGLLGLAFPSINTVTPQQAATPVANLISQSLIAQPLFTAKLDKGDSDGFYTFGYIDNTAFPSGNQITYAAVNSSNGFWEFDSPELKVGDKTVSRSSGNTAIADTGTTLILLDDNAVEAIYSSIPGAKLDDQQGGYIIPSSAQSSLPTSISFSVAGTFYSISGQDLLFNDVGDGSGSYFGSIQSRGQNPQDILGDVFLKRVYAIFNQGSTPQIGFAQRDLS